ERREVRAVRVVIALECRPRRVDEEGRQSENNNDRLDPPRISPRGLPKPTNGQPDRCSRCGHDTDPRWTPNELIAERAADPWVRRRRTREAITITSPAADFKQAVSLSFSLAHSWIGREVWSVAGH